MKAYRDNGDISPCVLIIGTGTVLQQKEGKTTKAHLRLLYKLISWTLLSGGLYRWPWYHEAQCAPERRVEWSISIILHLPRVLLVRLY
jgi:hypothetical protein